MQSPYMQNHRVKAPLRSIQSKSQALVNNELDTTIKLSISVPCLLHSPTCHQPGIRTPPPPPRPRRMLCCSHSTSPPTGENSESLWLPSLSLPPDFPKLRPCKRELNPHDNAVFRKRRRIQLSPRSISRS